MSVNWNISAGLAQMKARAGASGSWSTNSASHLNAQPTQTIEFDPDGKRALEAVALASSKAKQKEYEALEAEADRKAFLATPLANSW